MGPMGPHYSWCYEIRTETPQVRDYSRATVMLGLEGTAVLAVSEPRRRAGLCHRDPGFEPVVPGVRCAGDHLEAIHPVSVDLAPLNC